jgi:hypothetical protein
VGEPREGGPWSECRVRRESLGLKLLYLGYDFGWVQYELAGGLVSYNRVGRWWGFFPSSPVRNIDFSANLGLVMNNGSSFFPNVILRWLRACFRSRRVTRRWALKHALS